MKRRRDAGSDADASEDESVGFASFLAWYPSGNELIGRGVNNGFSGSKKKAKHQENDDGVGNPMRNCRHQRAEDTPPDDAGREHAARAKTIGEPAGRCLKKCVSEEECAEDKSQLNICDREFFGEFRAGDREIYPVEIGDCAEDKEPENEEPTYVGSWLGVHPQVQAAPGRSAAMPREANTIDLLSLTSLSLGSVRFEKFDKLRRNDFVFARLQHERIHAKAVLRCTQNNGGISAF